MATACTALPAAGVHEVGYHRQRTRRRLKIGLNDAASSIEEGLAGIYTRSIWRCDSASSSCCPPTPVSRPALIPSTYHKASALVVELLRSLPSISQPREDDPSRENSESNAPRTHLDSERLAYAHVERATSAPANPVSSETEKPGSELFRDPVMGDSVNFADTSGIQSRKGGKKAGKKGAQGRAPEADNENGTQNGEVGNDGEGSGGGGYGGAGDAGGDGDGGADGGNGDDWAFGGGKKNKKNKKNKKQEEEEKAKEEEEAKRRREEGEKKEGEEAAANNTLNWANDTTDANGDEEWASFSTKTNKKKKSKKVGEAADPSTVGLQEINLDDGAPKLDFNFGGTDSKKDTGGGGLGVWDKNWGLDSIGIATTSDKKDNVAAKTEKGKDVEESGTGFGSNSPWSFGNKVKTKKKTANSDFEFGDFGAGKDTADIDLGLDAQTDNKPAEDNTWGFSAVNKKDKKKKAKDAAVELEEAVTALPESEKEKETDDNWGFGAVNKKDKKKKAKDAAMKKEEPVTALPEPEPEPEKEVNNTWSPWATGKKEKKKTKDATVEKVETVSVLPEPEPEKEVEDTWGAWATGKKEKKKVKDATVEKVETVSVLPEPEPEAEKEVDDTWSPWATGKKEKKTTKDATVEKVETVSVLPEPEPEAEKEVDDTWSPWATSKKEKKKAKDATVEKAETVTALPETEKEKEMDNTWGLFGKSKKEKKKTKDATVEKVETVIALPEPEKEREAEDTWGVSGKSKKEKKKAKDAAVEKVETAIALPGPESENEVDDTWGVWGTGKKDKKKSKKELDEVENALSTLPAEPTVEPLADGISEWGSVGFSKKGKKKGAKGTAEEVKPEEKNEAAAVEPVSTVDWGVSGSKKDKKNKKKGVVNGVEEKEAKEEEARRAAEEEETRRAAEEEEARRAAEEEEARRAAEEEEAKKEAEAAALEKEKQEKASKSKAKGKPSKKEAKASKKTTDDHKAHETTLIDILDEPSPKEEKLMSKLKKTVAKDSANLVKEKEVKSDDYFGSWGSGSGSPKKTSGQKESETKKEIDKHGWTSEDEALTDFPNHLEDTVADEPIPTPKSTKAMSSTAIKNKTTAGLSVAARIKALEANKKEERAKAASQLAKDLSELPLEESPKEEKGKGPVPKSKAAAATSSKFSKKKEASPSPPAEVKRSKETVPGSFPGAFDNDDDLMALDDFLPTPEKNPTKKAKEERKTASKAKAILMEDLLVEAPEPPVMPSPPPEEKKPTKKAKEKKTASKEKAILMEDLLVEAPEPPVMPSPPPEEKKPVKKERTRVERTGAASSWGLWGTAPSPRKESAKKEMAKSVEDEVTSPLPKKKSAPKGLSRSKSTKTPKEKDQDDKRDVEKVSKSSGSDIKEKRAEARPAKPTRGMSFSTFMIGTAPPSATKTKSTRRSSVAGASRSVSRRQSIDVGGTGLMSPPPDNEPQISDKAAKLMGVKGGDLERTKSVKGKERAFAVHDPYPIDDDDMVLVNELEDPLLNGVSSKNAPKEKITSKSKSKREVGTTSNPISLSPFRPSWEPRFTKQVQADGKVSYKQSMSTKPRARTLSNEEDVVMVEAGPSGGEPYVTSGPDDMAFVEHSSPELRRSNTRPKKATGFFGGFFGGGGGKVERPPPTVARPRPASISYKDERMFDAEVPSNRTKDKTKRRSMKPSYNEAEAPDPAPLVDPEAEARRADRRAGREAEEAARRRSHRDREKAELEARRSRERDRARREREVEEQRREEKRARRAAREEARLKEEAEVEAEAAARREERSRLREQLELEKARVVAAAAAGGVGGEVVDKIRRSEKEDRKRQFEREEEERLRRREERKLQQQQGGKSPRVADRARPSMSKRKSTAASAAPSPLMDEYFESRNGTPKQAGGSGGPPDKTSSWVKSQTSDPPDLPQLEGTILDGEKARSADAAEFGAAAAAIGGGGGGDGNAAEEKRRRSSKRDPVSNSRRHSKYASAGAAGRDGAEHAYEDRRASRHKEARRSAAVAVEREDGGGGGIRSASGGSGGEHGERSSKHRSRRREGGGGGVGGYAEEYDAYADGGPSPMRSFESRGVNGKRNSILGRISGGLF